MQPQELEAAACGSGVSRVITTRGAALLTLAARSAVHPEELIFALNHAVCVETAFSITHENRSHLVKSVQLSFNCPGSDWEKGRIRIRVHRKA